MLEAGAHALEANTQCCAEQTVYKYIYTQYSFYIFILYYNYIILYATLTEAWAKLKERALDG